MEAIKFIKENNNKYKYIYRKYYNIKKIVE